MHRILYFLVGLLVVSTGCSKKESEIRSLEVALGAAAALGETAAIGLEAGSGASVVCASVNSACTTYPCDAEVTIELGAGCPVPLAGVASGTVTVSGTWESADSATLSSVFVNAVAGDDGRSVVVVNATTLSVVRSGDIVTVSYTGQDVDVNGAVALTNQSVWDITIDTAGTPGDPSDDTHTIDGVDQSVGGTQVLQLTVNGVVLDPSCLLNPIAGDALLQETSLTSIRNLTVDFHAACDGMADLASGPVELDFLE